MRSSALADRVAPAYAWCPDYAFTLGPEVAELCTVAGFPPDAEQQMVLDMLFARQPDRRVATFEAAVFAARQNLKTGALKQAALGWLWITDERLVVWSAHEFSTAEEAFRDLCQLIESCPDLDRDVKAIQRGKGSEEIELTNDRRLRFRARTKSAGRGLTGNKVVLDEAMYLHPHHMGSLLPTLSAVVNPQVVYAGSAGLATSDVQRSIRDRGRAGGDPSLAYVEWAAPDGGCAVEDCDHGLEATGCALDDPAAWQAANPAMGRRISVDYIAAERRALPPAEFARERLGWWDDPAGAVAVDLSLEAWRALANPAAAPSGDLVLGADVSPGHASASLYVFGVGPVPVGELIVRAPGSSWLVDRVASIVAEHPVQSVVVDPAGPVGSLIPALQAAGVQLVPLDGKESVRAYAAFCSAARDGAFRHRGEPDMDAAVMGARPRAVGDGSKWSRRGSDVDISPLVAATYAYWVASTRLPGEPNIYFL